MLVIKSPRFLMRGLNVFALDLDIVLFQFQNRNPLTPFALVFTLSIKEETILGGRESGV